MKCMAKGFKIAIGICFLFALGIYICKNFTANPLCAYLCAYKEHDCFPVFSKFSLLEIESALSSSRMSNDSYVFQAANDFFARKHSDENTIKFFTFILLRNHEPNIGDIALMDIIEEKTSFDFREKLALKWIEAITSILYEKGDRFLIRRFLEGSALLLSKNNTAYHDCLKNIEQIFQLKNSVEFNKAVMRLQSKLKDRIHPQNK